MRLNYQKQQGLSLIVALIMIVLLSLLGRFLVDIVAVGQQTTAREVLSTKALLSAESAANIVAMQLFPIDGSAANCIASQTIPFSDTGLAGCSASATCSSVTQGPRQMFIVEVRGSCGSNPAYQANRTIRVKLVDTN